MTDESNKPPQEQGELESLGASPIDWFWGLDWMCNFLVKTPPAALLVWSAIAIALAGLSTYIGVKVMSSSSPWDSSNATIIESGTFLSAGIFALPAFLLGIIGTLLPMWAVGRLIADAIKEGAQS